MVETIVSLVPAATDALCRLGLRHALAGRTQTCQWPPIVAGVPVVATCALHPSDSPHITANVSDTDLVFVPDCREWRDVSGRDGVALLPCAASIAQGIALVETVAAACRAETRGRRVAAALTQRHQRARETTRHILKKAPERTRRRVALLQGLTVQGEVYGCGYWASEAIEDAGGVSVVHAANDPRRKGPLLITVDILRELAPDAIVVGGSGHQAAEVELRESGLLPRLAAVCPVFAASSGGDAAIALSAAAKEGGAFAISAVEALSEVCLPQLFGTYGQIVPLAQEAVERPLPIPEYASVGGAGDPRPSSPFGGRASSCGSDGSLHDVSMAQPITQSSPQREQASALEVMYSRRDVSAVVSAHVALIRKGDFTAAHMLYTSKARRHTRRAALRSFAPALQRKLHIHTPQVTLGGDKGPTASVMVTVTDPDVSHLAFRWDLQAVGQEWLVVGIAGLQR